MEQMKFCKDCQGRNKSGWCFLTGYFVPKKQRKDKVNIAATCDHFKKK